MSVLRHLIRTVDSDTFPNFWRSPWILGCHQGYGAPEQYGKPRANILVITEAGFNRAVTLPEPATEIGISQDWVTPFDLLDVAGMLRKTGSSPMASALNLQFRNPPHETGS